MIPPRVRWLLVLVLLPAALWLILGRIQGGITIDAPRPALDYEGTIHRVEALIAAEDSTINPNCHTRIYAHGAKVARAVVLFHGFTNCPKQFDRLGAALAHLGFNVLIPRVPRHGLADRMTPALGALTSEDLIRSAEEAVDIAHGLGDQVSVVGLSSSGVVTAWLAQHRGDVNRAVLLNPSFAPKGMPEPVARRLTNLLLAAPNFFVWWNSRMKANGSGPVQCYPRFATRALAEVYRLGFLTLEDAAHHAPSVRSIWIVTTALDEGVNNGATSELARRWSARGAAVRTYEFPESLGVRHDMIDPDQPYQRVDVAYPVIVKCLTEIDDGAEGALKPRRGTSPRGE